jgi:LruC domain-containing protein
MMETPSGSFGVNTMLEAPYVTPVLRQLVVQLETPVTTQLTGFAPYNPFLIVDKTRGREVHLPGKTPTTLHDPAYFGQWFDNTIPAIGKYYQSASNLPWAINLPTQFDYPVEKTDITAAYLKFGSWAESAGQNDPDWYSNEGAGYRNEALNYKHEDQ